MSGGVNWLQLNSAARGLQVSLSAGCRLTEQRGADSPAAGRTAASVRRTSSSSSPHHQPQTATAAAAAAAAAAGSSSTLSASGDDPARSPSHVTASAAGAPAAVASPRYSAAVTADAQPQRAGSYHGELRRTNKNRFAESPLRSSSLDTAARVCTSRAPTNEWFNKIIRQKRKGVKDTYTCP